MIATKKPFLLPPGGDPANRAEGHEKRLSTAVATTTLAVYHSFATCVNRSSESLRTFANTDRPTQPRCFYERPAVSIYTNGNGWKKKHDALVVSCVHGIYAWLPPDAIRTCEIVCMSCVHVRLYAKHSPTRKSMLMVSGGLTLALRHRLRAGILDFAACSTLHHCLFHHHGCGLPFITNLSGDDGRASMAGLQSACVMVDGETDAYRI